MSKKPMLPEVKVVQRNRPHPNRWWRNHAGGKASDVAGTGGYAHRHQFEKEWTIRKKWSGNRYLVYEQTYCIYDGCGQIKVRHIKKAYCDHCGSLKT